MNLRVTYKRHIILFGLLLFVITQYSAMVHASAHYFHTPDQLCSTLTAIEHSTPGLINHQISIPVAPQQTSITVRRYTVKFTAYSIVLPSQAPPLA